MGFLIGRCCLYHVDVTYKECGSFPLISSSIRCRGVASDITHVLVPKVPPM